MHRSSTRHAAGTRRRRVALALAVLFASTVEASTLSIIVLDRDGAPVPNVAVYVESEALDAESKPTAVMDQRDVQFVPHILIVESGTSVEFPNNDEVAHHVYSFSKPNEFKLPIYKGESHPPVTFDHDGLVTLGCNIHDQMLAYVLVVDTPVFAKTNADGRVTFSGSGSGPAQVAIWSPRIKDRAESLTKEITLTDSTSATVEFVLEKKLRRAHDHDSDADMWSQY